MNPLRLFPETQSEDETPRRTPRRRAGRARILAATLALVLPSAVLALQNEPKGFGKAEFGMSVKAVRGVFPSIRELGKAAGSPLQIYSVDNQSYEGLGPCVVTLSFLADKLYETRFDCGRSEKVKDVLYERFGPPETEDEKMAIWRGDETDVSMNRQVKTFAFANRGLRAMLSQYLAYKALSANIVDSAPTTPPAKSAGSGTAKPDAAAGSRP